MKRKFLTVFTVMMILVLTMAFISCTDYEKEETPEENEKVAVTYNQLVQNGTFYDVSSSDNDGVYNSISSWTVTQAGLAVPTNGKNSDGGIFAGALDLTGSRIGLVLDEYKIESSEKPVKSTDENGTEHEEYVDLEEPIVFTNPGVDQKSSPKGKKDEEGNVDADSFQDTNALLLASVNTSGSIYAKSSDITIAQNGIYKLQFSVCSVVENKDSGAFVFIRGGMEKEYLHIDTNNEWQTYTLYIEGNKNSSMTITIELWLGYGPKKSTSSSYENDGNDKYATRGFALFDNIILTQLVDKDADEETEALFSSVFAGYDENASMHKNFLSFETEDDKYSAYYLKDADLANRSHITSTSAFGDSSSDRSLFYSLRDYTGANLATSYWETVKDSTAPTTNYGVVNPSVLYKKTATDTYEQNYSNMKDKFMSSSDWKDKVMSETYKNISKEEPYALMVYNDTLGASGFKTASSNSLTIENNKYYKITVYAYVWVTEYEGDKSYKSGVKSVFPAYDDTNKAEDNPAEVFAPNSDKNKTYAAVKKFVYNLSQDDAAAVTASGYFTELSADEKSKYADFDTADIMNAFKEKKINDEKTYYNEIITAVKTWLVKMTNDTLTDEQLEEKVKDMDDATAQTFLYAYLYYSWNDNAIVASPAYGQQEMVDNDFGFTADWLEKAYLQERNNNYATMNEMVEAVRKFNDETYPEYLEKKSVYDKALQAYKDECDAWMTANEGTPHAIFRISGAGEDIDCKTTSLNRWEEMVLFVRGNQLSDRTVTLNLLFGEDDSQVTKMVGGVFFDNVVIEEVDGDATSALNWHVLSEITDEKEVAFGDLVVATGDTPDVTGWKSNPSVDAAEGDSAKITVEAVNDEEDDLQQITIVKDQAYQYDAYKLVYKHTAPTASNLQYEGANYVKIEPNKYYRFAFQVKTKDVGSGISISLLKKTEKGEFSDFDTGISSYSSDDDWSEIVYYIQGAKNETYYLTIEVEMGSGTRFNTASYVEGEVWLASFNCLKITKEEYTSAATGDKIISNLSLETKTYSIDSGKITNASYSAFDYDKMSGDDYKEDGTIKDDAIIPITKWEQKATYGNSFEKAPKINWKDETKKVIEWEKVKYFTGTGADDSEESNKYEVWAKYKDKDNKEREVLINVVNTESCDLSILPDFDSWCECSIYVKAVNEKAVSPVSNEVTITKKGIAYPVASEYAATALKVGAKKTSEVAFDGEYVSSYDYIYTIHSDYFVSTNVASSSISLDADSYYKISVWVKTEGANAFGGLILTGSDGSVEANLTVEGSIGYSKIATGGEWKEYCIYVKTGNFSVSPSLNFCFGNPYAKGKEIADSDKKLFYEESDLAKGDIYFDVVRVETVKEGEYNNAISSVDANETEGPALLKTEYKLLYKNSESYAYTLQYTVDSFDTWTTSTATNADKFGYEPNNYEVNKGDNMDSDNTGANYTYGIYNASSDDENMKTALKYLYSSSDSEIAFNKYFSFAKDYTEAEWNAFLKDFLTLKSESGKSGGDNVLVLSNKIATGYAQYYSLESGYNFAIKSTGYYKLTFTASTLIAKPYYTELTGADLEELKNNWSTKKSVYYVKNYNSSKDNYTYAHPTSDAFDDSATYYTIAYTFDDCYAEMRYVSASTGTSDEVKMYISSYDADDPYLGSLNAKTYTLYIYNPSTTTEPKASWKFYLGDGKAVEDKTFTDLLVGMVAIDIVSVESIDEDAYNAGLKEYIDENGDIKNEKGQVMKYAYAADPETDDDSGKTDDDTDTDDEDKKDDFWTNLVNDQYFWLYISSFVLGIIIIVVVIVVLVRKFREKHPRKVVGENIVKTEKDIKVVEPEAQEKEEALESDEYVDEIKPIVQQRVLPKKKKKKK